MTAGELAGHTELPPELPTGMMPAPPDQAAHGQVANHNRNNDIHNFVQVRGLHPGNHGFR